MLRFRPIAPKPASGSSSSSGDPTVKKTTRGRPKRKYTRAKKNNIKSHEYYVNIHDPTTTVKTLQLFPNNTSDLDQGSGRGERQHSDPKVEKLPEPVDNRSIFGLFQSDQFDPRAVESVVTVESVTDVCTIARGVELGRTDEERVKNLELDKCPGFLSDAHNRVIWINPVFAQMTCAQDMSFVTLTAKTELPMDYPTFSCVVRVQMLDTRKVDKCPALTSQVLPCDVWRMGFGGLAWRLDLSAALSLGR